MHGNTVSMYSTHETVNATSVERMNGCQQCISLISHSLCVPYIILTSIVVLDYIHDLVSSTSSLLNKHAAQSLPPQLTTEASSALSCSANQLAKGCAAPTWLIRAPVAD